MKNVTRLLFRLHSTRVRRLYLIYWVLTIITLIIQINSSHNNTLMGDIQPDGIGWAKPSKSVIHGHDYSSNRSRTAGGS